MQNPDDTHFGGDWKYLTHWNTVIQILYYVILGVSVLMSLEHSETITRLHSTVFACLLFPLSCFVTSMFWTLYHIDEALVIHKEIEYQQSSWGNHMKHTFILLCTSLELYFISHQYPGNMFGSLISAAAAVLYLLWILIIHMVDGFWVYPILKDMSIPSRLLFFMSITALYCIFFIVGKFINSKFHKKTVSQYHFNVV